MIELNGIYCGPAPLPDGILARWNLDPVLLAALLALALAFRGNRAGTAAVAGLVVAFVSPLCALSAALFSARVVHHVILVAVVAPLIARALPGRRGAGGLWPAFAVSSLILWGWHVPAAYDLALSNYVAYWTMQLTLLGSATWFWRAVTAPERPPVEAMLAVVAGFAQMGMLGAILTFAPAALYAAHATAPLSWGLAPLADQQLGGLLMWVPAGLPYAVVGGFVARRGWTRLQGRHA